MTSLVDKKGPDHTSFGRFMDATTGEGACFLGALAQHMGLAVPEENRSASNVLGEGMVSDEMAVAFSIAMSLNDSGFEWKYILKAVDMVMESGDNTLSLGMCSCGCQASTGVSTVIAKIQALRALDKAQLPKCPNPLAGFVNGGYTTGANTPNLIPSINKITISFDGVSQSTYSLMSAFANVTAASQVAAKTDHALVA